MKSPRITYLIILLFALFAGSDAYAQWQNVALNALGNLYRNGITFGGASCFRDGKIWFGKTNLVMSTDTGKTWTDVSPYFAMSSEVILSIDFLDSLNGLVLTADKLFVTADGAQNWHDITPLFNNLICAFFIGNPLDIAVGFQGGLMMSYDAGQTFSATSLNTTPVIDGHWSRDGKASIIEEDNGSLHSMLFSTEDYGASWQTSGSAADYDCWSFDFDKCDTNVIYLVNDAAQTTNDGKSNLFVSTNLGSSWSISKSGPTDPKHFSSFFCGSVSSAATSTYAQTNTDGVIRTTDKGGSWIKIGGPNCGSDTRFVLAIDDNIVFAVDSNGSIWATKNSGGEGNGTKPNNGTLLVSQNLLDFDTLHCQGSISHTIGFIRTGCHNPSISNIKFIGSGASSYIRGNFTYDSLEIIFAPNKLGSNPAQLVVTLDDGSSDTISLNGWSDNIPFAYSTSPQTLFSGDTLSLCDPAMIGKYVITMSGCLPKIISEKITGAFQSDYTFVKHASNPLKNTDTIIISFKPGAAGFRGGSYELVLEDGTKILLPLLGMGKTIPYHYAFNPDLLFDSDSSYLCNSPERRKIIISAYGCPLPNIVSEVLTGVSSNDYNIVRKTANIIQGSDSLIIDFKPFTTGYRNANCLITLDNGNTYSIPLSGFGIGTQQLSFAISPLKTDTLGGSINLPISIKGLAQSEDIEFILHYTKELTYNGSFSPANVTLDMPGEQWSGRSKLHISQALPKKIAGYARFNIFNDSLTKSNVSFDSLVVLTSASPCQYIMPQVVSTDTISPPSDCGADILSRFMQHGILPQLSITPNPTSDETFISSTLDLGVVNIAVYDMLGVKQNECAATLKENNPAKIILPTSNGAYNVRVISGERVWDLRLIMKR